MMLRGLVITASSSEVPECQFSHTFALDAAQSWSGAYVSLGLGDNLLSTEKIEVFLTQTDAEDPKFLKQDVSESGDRKVQQKKLYTIPMDLKLESLQNYGIYPNNKQEIEEDFSNEFH